MGKGEHRGEHSERTNSSFSGRRLPKLTGREAQVLSFAREEGLISTKALSARLKCSKRYVQQLKSRLKNKGYKLEEMFAPEQNWGVGCEQGEHGKQFRLHAFKIFAEVLSKGRRYPVGAMIRVWDHSVQVHSGSITILQDEPGKGGFKADTIEGAEEKAARYYQLLLRKLESDLDAEFLGLRKQNVRSVYYEIAVEGSELAESVEKRGERLLVFDGGKLRFSTDRSRLYEHEYHAGPKRGGREDASAGEVWINDALDLYKAVPDAPRMSDLARAMGLLVRENRETAAGLRAVVESMRPREPREDGLGVSKRWYHG